MLYNVSGFGFRVQGYGSWFPACGTLESSRVAASRPYVYANVYLYIHTYIHTDIYIYIYTCAFYVYVCIYIYIHTFLPYKGACDC